MIIPASYISGKAFAANFYSLWLYRGTLDLIGNALGIGSLDIPCGSREAVFLRI